MTAIRRLRKTVSDTERGHVVWSRALRRRVCNKRARPTHRCEGHGPEQESESDAEPAAPRSGARAEKMEAGGIEPPSVVAPNRASTSLGCPLISLDDRSAAVLPSSQPS